MFKILRVEGFETVAQISDDNMQIRYVTAVGPDWDELYMPEYAVEFDQARRDYSYLRNE